MSGVKQAPPVSHLCVYQSCVPRDPTRVMECDIGIYCMCTSEHLQCVETSTLCVSGVNCVLKAGLWHVVEAAVASAGLSLPPAPIPGP